jgi:hypothetical protein
MSSTETNMIDLTKFCADEDTKHLRDHPYVRNGYRYVCNGRVALRLDAPGEADTDPDYTPPDIDGLIIEAASGTDWRPWPDGPYMTSGHSCLFCDGVGMVDRIACSTCKGGGDTQCPACHHERVCADCFGRGYTSGKECPNCHGNPCQSALPHDLVLIGRHISVKYGRLIETLPNAEWCADPTTGEEPLKPLGFRFTGGIGVIMPLNMEARQ